MKNISVGIEKLRKGAVVILSTKFMVSPFEKVTFEQRLKEVQNTWEPSLQRSETVQRPKDGSLLFNGVKGQCR